MKIADVRAAIGDAWAVGIRILDERLPKQPPEPCAVCAQMAERAIAVYRSEFDAGKAIPLCWSHLEQVRDQVVKKMMGGSAH